MGTRTTYRTSHRPILSSTKAAETFGDWMTSIFHRVGRAAMSRHHRIGSWEECASFRARALCRKVEKDASTQ
ncbi:MAG TPA: hypothetical protein VEB70_00960 [Noviherbaspirillum sp.]|nr:hypothetical protein [Noviherbaspirillum sp.]